MACPANNTTACQCLTDEQMTTLSYVFLSISCASFIGATSIVIAACVAKKVRSPEVLPLFHLSLADALGTFTAIISCGLYLVYRHRPIGENLELPVLCSVSIGFLNIFIFCTFILTVAYGIEVYSRLCNRFEGNQEVDQVSLKHRLAYAAAWLIPLILGSGFIILSDVINMDLSAFHNVSASPVTVGDLCLPVFHDLNDTCIDKFLPHNEKMMEVGKYTLLVPLFVVLLALAVIYVMVIRKFRKATISRGILGPQQRLEESLIKRRATCYIAVFGVCWIPSMVLGVLTLTPDFNTAQYYPLYVVQACTATLQGFLNSIVYGWSRTGFKQEVVTTVPSGSRRSSLENLYSHQALLPDSSSVEF